MRLRNRSLSKSPARKSPAKAKSPAKRSPGRPRKSPSPAKKSPAKKSAAKKSPAKRAKSPAKSASPAKKKSSAPSSKSSKGILHAGTWGREQEIDVLNWLLTMALFLGGPPMVIYAHLTLFSYDCDIKAPFLDMLNNGLWSVLQQRMPAVTLKGVYIYALWFIFQTLLSLYLPGERVFGQLTPAGHKLAYIANGFIAWALTHALFILTALVGVFTPTLIADNWGSLLIVTNLWGLFVSVFAYVKALTFPSHPGDCKYSSSKLYDFFMGVEFNPRFGERFDFKFFFNGRPGIVAWTLINASFAFAQYDRFGFVSNSMLLIQLLHAFYVVDFFLAEEWYTHTIDINHDHFGFYLGWGDTVWLPFMYTLQAQYLSLYPYHMSGAEFTAVLALGCFAYYLFRKTNSEKDDFRAAINKGETFYCFGQPATYIEAKFKTTDGKQQTTHLLTSGWWGLVRHPNYLADLLGCLSYSMCCGWKHVLPHFYLIWMAGLLFHRTFRIDSRCHAKYGKTWDDYKKAVKYKLIPYVL